jgi:hypothetical protein
VGAHLAGCRTTWILSCILAVTLSLAADTLFADQFSPSSTPGSVEPTPFGAVQPISESRLEGDTDSLFESLRLFVDAGAPGLALRLIDRYQPPLAGDTSGWERWEQERIGILRAHGREEELIERVTSLPSPVRSTFRDWAEGRRIDSLLALGRGESARLRLQRLIWSNGEPATDGQLAEWRRQLIKSYLLLGQADDAYRAMVRYQQDYGEAGHEWLLLQARVLLLAGRYDDALARLQGVEGIEAQLLAALATLRAADGRLEVVEEVVAQARVLGGGVPEGRYHQFALLLLAEGEQLAGRLDASLMPLEELFRQSLPDQWLSDLFSLDIDRLWRGWRALGEQLGNESLLLIGQDQPWFDRARQLLSENPLAGRALLVALALNSHDSHYREAAHRELARQLAGDQAGVVLLRRLYIDSGRWSQYRDIPAAVRYRLLDGALAEGDMPFASALMASLPRPPEGEQEGEWSLRRARVMILGGEESGGIEAMIRLLEAGEPLSDEEVERYQQVLFDLQSVSRHREVIELFGQLIERCQSPRLRREMLYWIGDSWRALGDDEQAAGFYLRSAGYSDAWSLDQWAQSARFAAAESLADAGLADDARLLYQRLLEVSREPARKALLRHRIQELWLVRDQDSRDSTRSSGQ